MYRAGLEYLLGLEVRGNELRLNPRIPPEWEGFEIRYRFGKSNYLISVKNPSRLEAGFVEFPAGYTVALIDDGKDHSLEGVIR
ncbi:MAG: glycosyl hydrolase family 65 protein [Bdellovibrionota bacterium]